ncbi:MAG: PKD domain-containing protein [Bacteroidota bacterium]
MLLLFLCSACEEESIVNFNSDTTVPRDLSLIITMDESVKGKVRISPTATAANRFEILFGDVEGETPTEVAVGGTVEHIYEEGVYLVQLVATGVSGETSTTSAVVEMSFDPVANFEASHSFNAENPMEITVTASADNATLFEVTFGDDASADPVSFMPGESVTYTYAAEGDYTVSVTAIGCDPVRPLIEIPVTVIVPTDPILLPIDFELDTSAYVFGSFGNAGAGVVANPDMNGNPSAQVGEFNKPVGAETWAGTSILLSEPIDFSSEQLFRMKIWSPVAGATFLMKIENADDNNIALEIPVTNTVTNGWEELTFDFSAIDQSQVYQRIVLFFNFDVAGDGSIFYFDDITQGDDVAAEISFPLDFEQAPGAYPFMPFGDPVSAAVEVVANPDMSGNSSAQVGQFTKPSGSPTWAGFTVLLDDPIDFSTTQTFSMRVWSPKVGAQVLFKFENADDNSIFDELPATTTVANQWETLTWDFSGRDLSAVYQRLALFFDFGVDGDDSVYYFDDIDQGEGGGNDPIIAFPLDFEQMADAYPFAPFGAPVEAGIAVIANPDMNGNSSAQVAEFTKPSGAPTWAGVSILMDDPIDFSTTQTFSMRVWSPKVGAQVLFKIENADDNTLFDELPATTTVANQWEILTWDFSGRDLSATFQRLALFFDFGVDGDDSIYYFDDVSR